MKDVSDSHNYSFPRRNARLVRCRRSTPPGSFHEMQTSIRRLAFGLLLSRRNVDLVLFCRRAGQCLRISVRRSSLQFAFTLAFVFNAFPSMLRHQLLDTEPDRYHPINLLPPVAAHFPPGICAVSTRSFCVPCVCQRRVSTSSPSVTPACACVSFSKLGGTMFCTFMLFACSSMATSTLTLSRAVNCLNASVILFLFFFLAVFAS